MQTLTQPDQIQRFFVALGERCPQGSRLYLFGGSALLWLGGPRHTADVDVALAPASETLRQLVAETLLANGHLQLDALARHVEDVASRFDEPIRLRRQFADFRKTL